MNLTINCPKHKEQKAIELSETEIGCEKCFNNKTTNKMSDEKDIEEYAKYKMRTITGENGVSKHEMLSYDDWLWNNKPYENLENE